MKYFEATFCRSALLFSFCENRFRLLRFIKKLNSTKRGAFFNILRLQGDHYCACPQKRCHFSYFSKTFQTKKKIKKLWPKMTKIASGGGGGSLPQGEHGEIIASQRHFPDFYTKQVLKVWRSSLHADFHWNVKGKARKQRKNTASFVASLGAGVQPRSTLQLSMPVIDVEKRPSSQCFLGFGVSYGEEKPFVTSNASF